MNVLDNQIDKEELIQWVNAQIEQTTSRDDNVVTRLGMVAAFQIVLEKLKE